MGAGIQPGEAAAEGLDQQFSIGQESLVHGSDLEFAPRGRLDGGGDIDDLIRIEIQPGDRIVGLGLRRLFLDGNAVALGIEFRHAITFGVGNPITEDRRFAAVSIGHSPAQLPFKAGAMEDVVSQDHAGGIVADEFPADDESLGQAVGRRLLGIGETDAIIGAVSQQTLEAGQVVRRGDDQDILDTGQHEHGDRIVDHRLVIDGKELLGNSFGNGIEAGTASAGKNDSFHNSWL